jgi:murein DD-endopeptidase MepM/ murein hydrolase activator NlpD
MAYDFILNIGDTIVASRGGTVIYIREDFSDEGMDATRFNYIYIEHDDGSLAFYAHLKQNGVVVEPLQTVERGQFIALGGNSGLYGVPPHLHFGVYENFPPLEGFDMLINFSNAEGNHDERNGLMKGENYLALPY